MSSKVRIFVFSFFLFLGATVAANAQTPTPTPDAGLTACEQTADLAKRLQIENAGLKAQLDLANQKLAVKDEQVANKEEQLQFWKKAAQTGDKIDNNSQIIVATLRGQVADDQLRIKDLEQENKSLRSSREWRTVFGFVGGMATGYFIHK